MEIYRTTTKQIWGTKVITEKEYKNIRKHWKQRVYSDYWVLPRMKIFLEIGGHYLKEAKILEVGANSGIFAVDMCKLADSYTGLEKDPMYYEQAIQTAKFIDNPKAKFIKADLNDWSAMPAHPLYDTFVGLFVVYHFYNPEVAIWREEILPECDKVVLQLRNGGRKTIKNKYGFHKPHNTTRFLHDAGFKIRSVYWQPRKRQFVTITAAR